MDTCTQPRPAQTLNASSSNTIYEYRRDRSLAAVTMAGCIGFAMLAVMFPSGHSLICLSMSALCFGQTLLYLFDRRVKLTIDDRGITTAGLFSIHVAWKEIASLSHLTITKRASVQHYIRLRRFHGPDTDIEIGRLDQPVEQVFSEIAELFQSQF